MASKSKRLKIQSADPLNLIHSDVHELIFQHFDAADALIYSGVSTTWFETIGHSRKGMKEVKLGLNDWWVTQTPRRMEIVMKILRNTARNYQDIEINARNNMAVGLASIKMLRSHARSLINLKLEDFDEIGIENKFEFPRLEFLQLINTSPEVDELLMKGSKKLKELNLKHHYNGSMEPLIEGLKHNKHLEMLKLSDNGISELFKNYDSNWFNFKLKRFASGCDGTIDEETGTKFIHFLATQSDSLEAIRFRFSRYAGISGRILAAVFGMKAIRIVHVDAVAADLSTMVLPLNRNIKELRFPRELKDLEKLLPFLESAPNVTDLHFVTVNNEILNYAAEHLKSLTTIYYSSSNACFGCFAKRQAALSIEIDLVAKSW